MKNTGKIVLSVFGVFLSITLLVTSAILAEEGVINFALSAILIAISTVFVFVSVLYAAKVDYETGIYECRKCKFTFKPSFKAYIMGAHTLKTRHLKCPKCKKISWCVRKSL